MRTVAALPLAILTLAFAGAVAPVEAADVACPPPADAAGPGGFQVWLDRDIARPDAPAGERVEAGLTFWDPRQRQLFAMSGLEACLHPAAGDATPAPGAVRSDFPGHVVAEFVVPDGGAGTVRIGTRAQVCASSGTCTSALVPIPLSGTGPPPDADPSVLLGATIRLDGGVVVGRPAGLIVEVAARGLWEPSTLGIPDHLLVVAARRGEPPVATAEIRPVSLATEVGEYRGSLVIREPGEFMLHVAVPGDDGVERAIGGSDVVLRVGGDAPASSARPSDAPLAPVDASGGAGVPVVAWLLAAGAVVVAVGFVVRRAVSDL